VTTGDLATISGGGVPPYSFSLENLENDPVLDNDGNPITSIHDPVVYRNFVAGPPASIEGWTDIQGEEGFSRHVFTLELNADGTFTFTLVDTIDHPDATTGSGDGTQEETLFIDFSDAVRVTDFVGQTAIIGDFSSEPVFSVGVIDDTPIADLDAGEVSAVSVDETVDSTFSSPDGSAVWNDETASGAPSGAIGFVTASLGTIYSDHSLYGADLPGSTTYSLVLNGNDSGLLYSVTDEAILLAQDLATGNIIGYIGGVSPNDPAFVAANKVFEFSIDAFGNITLAQFKAVEHPNAGDYGTADQDEPTAMAEGIIGVGVHVTDGDEDASNDTIDIGSHFNFEDDGIFVNVFRAEVGNEGSGTIQVQPPIIELDESIDSANDGFDPNPASPEDRYSAADFNDGNGDLDDVSGVSEPSLLTTANSSLAIGIRSTAIEGTGSIASLFDFDVVAGTDEENTNAQTAEYKWSLFGPGGGPAGSNGIETTLRVTALDDTAVAGPNNPALEGASADARTIYLFQVSDTEIVGKIGQDTPETTDDFVAMRFIIDPGHGRAVSAARTRRHHAL
jgi:hypothetical protein